MARTDRPTPGSTALAEVIPSDFDSDGRRHLLTRSSEVVCPERQETGWLRVGGSARITTDVRPSDSSYLRGDAGDLVQVLYIEPDWIYASRGSARGWLAAAAVGQPQADDPVNLKSIGLVDLFEMF